MLNTDIAIVGGGLAGSICAALLGRRGFNVTLIDPHRVYPSDFRCEKLDRFQIGMLRNIDLLDPVLRAATHAGAVRIAQFGRVIGDRPGSQLGILYEKLVNTIRAEIPSSVSVIHAKVASAVTGSIQQRLTLSNGEAITTRLMVLTTGLNPRLGHKLGMTREYVSPCHSLTIGFDIWPCGRPSFALPALTYYPEDASSRMALLSLFQLGAVMRANLMVYRDLRDPWLEHLRRAPQSALLELMPNLERATGPFEVVGPVKIRRADLCLNRGYLQPGIVLAGDAFATSCPAAGTGVNKVFTDAERLCNIYIPRWLATPGMGVDKIACFYADPMKQAIDAHSWAFAYSLRSLSINRNVASTVRRAIRFAGRACLGVLYKGQRALGVSHVFAKRFPGRAC